MPEYETTASGLLMERGAPRTPTAAMREALQYQALLEAQNQQMSERLSQIEIELASEGWVRFDQEESRQMSREGLDQMVRLARLMFISNPLINKGVSDVANYVFGQGVSVRATHELLNELVQAFWDDRANRAELTSARAQKLKDIELSVAGNVFLVLFTNPRGRVKLRSIPLEQVRDIVANPEDWRDPWFYKREYEVRSVDPRRSVTSTRVVTWHPDWQFRPARADVFGDKPKFMDAAGHEAILWDQPVYHVVDGGMDGMRFGLPSCYSALSWARAVQRELEATATVHQALMRYVLQLKVPSGTNAQGVSHVQAATTRLRSTIGTAGSPGETNPPDAAGSPFVHTEGVELAGMQTRGMAPDPEDGRRFWLMAQAGIGTPYSFVDPDQGNHATAKTLDRPTELMMVMRQGLWRDVYQDLCQYQIDQAALMGMRGLDGVEEEDDAGEAHVVIADPETAEPIDRSIDVSFPSLLERDVTVLVDAIISSATLEGKPLAGTLSVELTTRLLLEALAVPNLDEVMTELFPEGEEEPPMPEEAGLTEALVRLREVLAAQHTNGVAHA